LRAGCVLKVNVKADAAGCSCQDCGHWHRGTAATVVRYRAQHAGIGGSGCVSTVPQLRDTVLVVVAAAPPRARAPIRCRRGRARRPRRTMHCSRRARPRRSAGSDTSMGAGRGRGAGDIAGVGAATSSARGRRLWRLLRGHQARGRALLRRDTDASSRRQRQAPTTRLARRPRWLARRPRLQSSRLHRGRLGVNDSAFAPR
jgi:hypothetical protein